MQADKVGKQVRLVHEEMVPDACIEHLFGYILVIRPHMVERIIDAVGGILLAMAVGRQYEDTFSGTGQLLPVASIGSGRQESQTWKQAFPELIAIEHGFHHDEDGVTS